MTSERQRIQIEATNETAEELKSLLASTALPNTSQVVRVAIRLLYELHAHGKTGGHILLVKEGQEPERLKLLF